MHEISAIGVVIKIAIFVFGFILGSAFIIIFNEKVVDALLKTKKELIYQFEAKSEKVISKQENHLDKTYKTGLNHVNDIGKRIELLFNGLDYVDKELKRFNTSVDELQMHLDVRKELENEIIKLKNIIKRMERRNG